MQNLMFFSVKLLASMLMTIALTYLLYLAIAASSMGPLAAMGFSIISFETISVASLMVVFNDYSTSAFAMLAVTIASVFLIPYISGLNALLLPPAVGLIGGLYSYFSKNSNEPENVKDTAEQSSQTNMSFFSKPENEASSKKAIEQGSTATDIGVAANYQVA